MGQQADVERMKTATVGQAYNMLHRQAATEKLRRETGLLGVTEPGEQWQVSEPDEFGRVFRTNLATGKKEQVSGPTPTPPLTMEEREKLKKIPTDIFRGTWFRNPDTGDILPVDAGTKPPDGYTEIVPSREVQVSDLPRQRLELTKDKAIRDSAVRIRMNLKNPAVMGEIDFINKNSDSTTGFIWLETAKTFWPDAKETVEVKLPRLGGKQLTMEDVRRDAKRREITVDDVLREFHEYSLETK